MRLRRKTLPPRLSEYPIGTFIKTEKGFFFIAGPNKRFRFTTKRVLDSWRPDRIVSVSEMAVARYRVASKMKFRNGSLLYSQADGKMYLISEHKARHITNPDVLAGIGATRADAVWVSAAEINLHEKGLTLD